MKLNETCVLIANHTSKDIVTRIKYFCDVSCYHSFPDSVLCTELLSFELHNTLVDLAGVLGAPPILLFLHTVSPKSTRIGGRCPPRGQPPPPSREILDQPLLHNT